MDVSRVRLESLRLKLDFSCEWLSSEDSEEGSKEGKGVLLGVLALLVAAKGREFLRRERKDIVGCVFYDKKSDFRLQTSADGGRKSTKRRIEGVFNIKKDNVFERVRLAG